MDIKQINTSTFKDVVPVIEKAIECSSDISIYIRPDGTTSVLINYANGDTEE